MNRAVIHYDSDILLFLEEETEIIPLTLSETLTQEDRKCQKMKIKISVRFNYLDNLGKLEEEEVIFHFMCSNLTLSQGTS